MMEKTDDGIVTTYWFKDGTSDFAIERIEDSHQVSLQMLHDCGGAVDLDLLDLIKMCQELANKAGLRETARRLYMAMFLAQEGR